MSERTCTENDCAEGEKARGLCNKHLLRLYRTGTTAARPRKPQPEGGRRCSEPSCTDPHEARGYCNRHYKQKREAGELPVLRRTLRDRFEEKVDRQGPIPPHRPDLGPCHLWTAGKNKNGYGSIGLPGQDTGSAGAHRVAWELYRGPIPEGMHVDHMCHRHDCVNVAHLRLATVPQNAENYSGGPRPHNQRSRHRGVCWDKTNKKWKVTVRHHGRQYSGGYFALEHEDAAGEAARQLRLRLHTYNDADRAA